MTTIQWQEVASLSAAYNFYNVQSFVHMTNHDLVVAVLENGDPGATRVLRSSDNGATWHTVATLPGQPSTQFTLPRLLHLKPNILILATPDAGLTNGEIRRSTDGGSNWDAVATAPLPGIEAHSYPGYLTGTTYGRTSALGFVNYQLNEDEQAFKQIRSTNFGASWSEESFSTPFTPPIVPCAYANGAGGKIYCSVPFVLDSTPAPLPGGFAILKSTNHGASFTSAAELTVPTDTTEAIIHTICALRHGIMLAGGFVASETDPTYVPLWRSTDDGASWSHVSVGDIINWPSDEPTLITQIKNLAEGAILLSLAPSSGGAPGPWRLSNDAGETFPTETDGGPGGSGYAKSCPTIARNGKILAATGEPSGDAETISIWSGTYIC